MYPNETCDAGTAAVVISAAQASNLRRYVLVVARIFFISSSRTGTSVSLSKKEINK